MTTGLTPKMTRLFSGGDNSCERLRSLIEGSLREGNFESAATLGINSGSSGLHHIRHNANHIVQDTYEIFSYKEQQKPILEANLYRAY